jgi:hypothetical protein
LNANECGKSTSLKYAETIKVRSSGRYKQLNLEFSKICPTSSETIKKQTTPHSPEGLTLVAFLGKEHVAVFNKIIEQIKNLNHRFCSTRNLHSTFLTIFPYGKINKITSNPQYEYLVKNKVSEFFSEKIRTGHKIDCPIEFKHVRPGSWTGLNDNQIPFASDGTVAAIGDLTSEGNKKFVNLAEELECYLKRKLGSIFGIEYQRPFTTVWCTLGYFDCTDFCVDDNFHKTLDLCNSLNGSLPMESISELQLVKHRFRSLDCYRTILKIP